MKARIEHRVPALPAGHRLVARFAERGRFVFIGARAGKAIGRAAMGRVLDGLGADGVNPHGFRSSLRTWTEERTSYPTVLAEQALAHVVGSVVERSYRGTDLFEQRARLMQSWADYSGGPIGARERVTPLRRIRS